MTHNSTNPCIGCGGSLRHPPVLNALSRYGHGYICSDCGMREAFDGDFITAGKPISPIAAEVIEKVHEVADRDPMDKRIQKYMRVVTDLNAEYWAANKFTFASAPTVEAMFGRRYVRIVIVSHGSRSVHSFVDITNGDIHKGTWKAPVKNGVRGNIFADDVGRSVITNHGPKYLR